MIVAYAMGYLATPAGLSTLYATPPFPRATELGADRVRYPGDPLTFFAILGVETGHIGRG